MLCPILDAVVPISEPKRPNVVPPPRSPCSPPHHPSLGRTHLRYETRARLTFTKAINGIQTMLCIVQSPLHVSPSSRGLKSDRKYAVQGSVRRVVWMPNRVVSLTTDVRIWKPAVSPCRAHVSHVVHLGWTRSPPCGRIMGYVSAGQVRTGVKG